MLVILIPLLTSWPLLLWRTSLFFCYCWPNKWLKLQYFLGVSMQKFHLIILAQFAYVAHMYIKQKNNNNLLAVTVDSVEYVQKCELQNAMHVTVQPGRGWVLKHVKRSCTYTCISVEVLVCAQIVTDRDSVLGQQLTVDQSVAPDSVWQRFTVRKSASCSGLWLNILITRLPLARFEENSSHCHCNIWKSYTHDTPPFFLYICHSFKQRSYHMARKPPSVASLLKHARSR